MEEAKKLARCSEDPHPSGSQTKGIHHDRLIFFSSAPPLFLARAAKNSGVSISYQDGLSLFSSIGIPLLSTFSTENAIKHLPFCAKRLTCFMSNEGRREGRRCTYHLLESCRRVRLRAAETE